MRMTENQVLIDYLLLLRYGCTDAPHLKRPILNYSTIARITRKPVSTIRDLIKLGLESKIKKIRIEPRKRTKLEQHHLDFLSSPQTLNRWAHLSLKMRVIMFHRAFPEVKISVTLLRRLYKKHGIKFKCIFRGKKDIDFDDQFYRDFFRQMYDGVKVARLRDIKLLWVDETMFTFRTFAARAWSAKHQSIEVKDADIRVNSTAFLGAISEDGGLEAYALHPRAISTTEFVAFVETIAAKYQGCEVAMFMDNLPVHRSR